MPPLRGSEMPPPLFLCASSSGGVPPLGPTKATSSSVVHDRNPRPDSGSSLVKALSGISVRVLALGRSPLLFW